MFFIGVISVINYTCVEKLKYPLRERSILNISSLPTVINVFEDICPYSPFLCWLKAQLA